MTTFKPDFMYNANMSRGIGGFSLTHRGGKAGRIAREAFCKAQPKATEQGKYLLDDHEYFMSDAEIIAHPQIVDILDAGGICTSAVREMLVKNGVQI